MKELEKEKINGFLELWQKSPMGESKILLDHQELLIDNSMLAFVYYCQLIDHPTEYCCQGNHDLTHSSKGPNRKSNAYFSMKENFDIPQSLTELFSRHGIFRSPYVTERNVYYAIAIEEWAKKDDQDNWKVIKSKEEIFKSNKKFTQLLNEWVQEQINK